MNNRTVTSRIVKISLSFAMAVAVSGSGPALAAAWTAATPYPTTITDYAFAQNGEDMYVISGQPAISGSTITAVRRYNARTNVWTSLADIPAGSLGSAVFFGGKIYYLDSGFTFRIYDVATNTWSTGPSRPAADGSFGSGLGAFNGNVYAVGGGFTDGGSTELSIYNIASNTWSTGPPAPSSYQLGGYAQIGQFLYLIGGYTTTFTNSNVSMRLDMSTNSWSTGPVWNPRRADFALAAAGTMLFAIGGDGNGGGFYDPVVQVHELETSTWPAGGWFFSADNLPSPRQGMKAGFFSTGRAGGEIWSTGGNTADLAVALNEHLFRPVPVPCQDYNITESTRTLVPGTNDSGNHCDDCLTGTVIPFPFPVRFYGTTYGSARASSNGNLQFNSANVSSSHTNLPATGFNATIFAYWIIRELISRVVAFSPQRVAQLRTASLPSSGASRTRPAPAQPTFQFSSSKVRMTSRSSMERGAALSLARLESSGIRPACSHNTPGRRHHFRPKAHACSSAPDAAPRLPLTARSDPTAPVILDRVGLKQVVSHAKVIQAYVEP